MTDQLNELVGNVSKMNDAAKAAAAVVASLAEQLRAVKDDPVAIEALAADLDVVKADLEATMTPEDIDAGSGESDEQTTGDN